MNLYSLIPNVIDLQDKIVSETIQTIKLVVVSGSISFVIGLLLALCLILVRQGGLKPSKTIYAILSGIINLLRAMPFVILVFALIDFTRFLVGSSISFAGSIVPLVISAAPFFARQFETAFLEVDSGVIEAALSMGLSNTDILIRVYLKEALSGLVRGTVITLINLLGLTTMIGVVGGGGIGNLAVMYGQGRNMQDIIYCCVLIILVLVYVIQLSGNMVLKVTEKGE